MINLEKRVLGKKKEVEILTWMPMIFLTNFSVEGVFTEVQVVDSIFNLILEEEVHLVEGFTKTINNNSEKKFQTYFKTQVILKPNIF